MATKTPFRNPFPQAMRLMWQLTGAWNIVESVTSIAGAIKTAVGKSKKESDGHVQSPNKLRLNLSLSSLTGLFSGTLLSSSIAGLVNIAMLTPALIWSYVGKLSFDALRSLISFFKSLHLSRPQQLLNDIKNSRYRVLVALKEKNIIEGDITLESINQKIDELKKQGVSLKSIEELNKLRAGLRKKYLNNESEFNQNIEKINQLTTLYQLLNYRRLLLEEKILTNGIKNPSNRTVLYYSLIHAHRTKVINQLVNFIMSGSFAAGLACFSVPVLFPLGMALFAIGGLGKMVFTIAMYVKTNFHAFLVHEAEKNMFHDVFSKENIDELKNIFSHKFSENDNLADMKWDDFLGELLIKCKNSIIKQIGEIRWDQFEDKQETLQHRSLMKTYFDAQLKKQMGDDYYAMNSTQKTAARADIILKAYYKKPEVQQQSPIKTFFNWLIKLGKSAKSDIDQFKEKPVTSIVKRIGRIIMTVLMILLGVIIFPIALPAVKRQYTKNIRKAKEEVSDAAATQSVKRRRVDSTPNKIPSDQQALLHANTGDQTPPPSPGSTHGATFVPAVSSASEASVTAAISSSALSQT